MANQGFRRSFRTPRGYNQDPGGRDTLFNQVYVGFVKNNEDAFTMGRLQVWIPEISGAESSESSWFTVQYCSPFAGATSHKDNKKQGQELGDTQQSYGWWAVPPDLENEVVVMFINGDPNRGIYIGGLYQQFMNHMVPGIPTGKSYKDGLEGMDPPVAEYNRWDPSVPNSDNHTRARFEPLHEGLKAQGLYEDQVRGTTDAGARRAAVSKVYGFKSPEGHHMVFDDSDEGYIRFRTRSGAQIIINDATGYVYMISGNGNSWFEISDDGIDGYSAGSVSFRAGKDVNLHADGSINLHANKGWNAYGAGGVSVQSGASLDVLAGGTANISSAGNLNLLSKAAASMTATGNASVEGGGTLALQSGGALGVTAGGNVVLKGAQIQQNTGGGPTATAATEAKGPKPGDRSDRELNADAGYPQMSTQSIVSRMPAHEPWDGHPGTKSGAAKGAGAGSSGSGSSEVGVEGTGDEVDDSPPVDIPDDGTKFCVPVTAICGSPFGFRIHPIKKVRKMHYGVDFKDGGIMGRPVYASKGGKVIFAGNKGGYGKTVIVDHGNGMTTLYAHMSAISVSRGATVKQMDTVGKVGSTGGSTGPHLHFEVRKNGAHINPAQVIPFNRGGRVKAGQQK